MWARLLGRDFVRRRLHARAPRGPIADYYAAPFPGTRASVGETEFLALDLETTGLDAGRDEILSIGMVVVARGQRVDLGTACHRVVLPGRAIPQGSAVIHRITDDRAAAGIPLRDAVELVLGALTGRVLLAHHARVECGFLDAACRALYGVAFVAAVADTEALVRRSLERRHQSYRLGDLRLNAVRERYGLPRYRAHDALSDALGAAEVLIAHVAHAGGADAVRVRDVLTSL
jgi:DNA polymerase-3 subunit epsilon